MLICNIIILYVRDLGAKAVGYGQHAPTLQLASKVV